MHCATICCCPPHLTACAAFVPASSGAARSDSAGLVPRLVLELYTKIDALQEKGTIVKVGRSLVTLLERGGSQVRKGLQYRRAAAVAAAAFAASGSDGDGNGTGNGDGGDCECLTLWPFRCPARSERATWRYTTKKFSTS